MGIAASQIIILLSPLLVVLADELFTEVFYGLLVALHSIVAIADMKAGVVVLLHSLHSLFQAIHQSSLLFFEDLQSIFIAAFIILTQSIVHRGFDVLNCRQSLGIGRWGFAAQLRLASAVEHGVFCACPPLHDSFGKVLIIGLRFALEDHCKPLKIASGDQLFYCFQYLLGFKTPQFDYFAFGTHVEEL